MSNVRLSRQKFKEVKNFKLLLKKMSEILRNSDEFIINLKNFIKIEIKEDHTNVVT